MGKNDLFLVFLAARNGNLRRSAAVRNRFLPVFTCHLGLKDIGYGRKQLLYQ